jgi:competence protein ComEC
VRSGSASLSSVLRTPGFLLVIAVTACVSAAPREGGPPPPRGKTMDEYLREEPPPAPAPADSAAGDSMKLHVIDVGQGTALLLEFPCAAVLVDTGGEQNEQFDSVQVLVDYLDRFFARRTDLHHTLALLVISHPHIDHTRGIKAVLSSFTVKNVVDNGDVRDDIGGKPQLALHAWLAKNKKKKIGHLDLARSDIDGQDGLTSPVIDPVGACPASKVDPVIRALWSGDLGREEIGQNPNNDSVVLRVDFGDSSLLLPGDIELLAIARLIKKYAASPALLDADVYVVPHHGSKNSSTLDLVRRVTPELAVISAGPYERYLRSEEEYTARVFGHPNQVSIDHLLDRQGGVSGRRAAPIEAWVGVRGAWKETRSEFTRRTIDRAIYATSWDGTVVVTATASGRLDVTTQKAPTAAQTTSGGGTGASAGGAR